MNTWTECWAAGTDASARLNEHLVTASNELMNSGWRYSNTIFVVLNLSWNSDAHFASFCLLLAGGIESMLQELHFNSVNFAIIHTFLIDFRSIFNFEERKTREFEHYAKPD